MTSINQKIQNTKSDIILLAEDMYQAGYNNIDDYALAELKSNMEAMIKLIDKIISKKE